jgi:hypothetical protein
MSQQQLPWRNVGLELVGFAPDSVRRRIRKVRLHIETLTSETELDKRLDRAAELFDRSDDEARAYLASFELKPPKMPADPFSDEYKRAQWNLYKRIAQRDNYEVTAEHMELDVKTAISHPYPYSTGSSLQVADQLAASAFIMRELQFHRGQTIVEFGPGWGNLTLQIAMMSIDVTAVEVNPLFVELLRGRGGSNSHMKVVESDMLLFEPPARFDAAIFFESFHHCSDHLAMLARLRHIVADDGYIAFAGEPIASMAYPWGLRLDGLSLWCTRHYGWLELGFDRRYFTEALRRTGWTNEQRLRSRSMSTLADMVIARRS